MKKFLFFLFFVFVFICQNAGSLEISEYNITFDILPDGHVNEKVSMLFAEKLNTSSLNYVVLGDVSDLSITTNGENIDYTLEKTGNENNVRFVVPENTESLEIGFLAKDFIFTRENIYSFSTNIQPPVSDKVNVMAFLPKGFAIYSDVVYPGDCETLTDGERIYLKWGLEKPEDVAISFKFYNTHEDLNPALIAALLLVSILVIAYVVAHYRKKVKREFMRGFTEDEGKVLKELSERKVCMQKKLEKEFGFSRAKMTRIVKTLESKGFVEKERVGRTNRLFFKK